MNNVVNDGYVEIVTLDQFLLVYPDAYWLENDSNRERWCNGLGEGTYNESLWFDEDGFVDEDC